MLYLFKKNATRVIRSLYVRDAHDTLGLGLLRPK
jgi:hypothetical protein